MKSPLASPHFGSEAAKTMKDPRPNPILHLLASGAAGGWRLRLAMPTGAEHPPFSQPQPHHPAYPKKSTPCPALPCPALAREETEEKMGGGDLGGMEWVSMGGRSPPSPPPPIPPPRPVQPQPTRPQPHTRQHHHPQPAYRWEGRGGEGRGPNALPHDTPCALSPYIWGHWSQRSSGGWGWPKKCSPPDNGCLYEGSPLDHTGHASSVRPITDSTLLPPETPRGPNQAGFAHPTPNPIPGGPTAQMDDVAGAARKTSA